VVKRSLEQNLVLYPAYQACRGLLFWLPVFFLYFSSVLTVGEVLLLEAIYYLGVVCLEVPSGYFSDRVGRRLTLLIGMACWAAAGALFAASGAFLPFAAAQLLMAAGMAFNSGTDQALLYGTLAALGRGDEVSEAEGRAGRWHFTALATSALVGGLLSGLDLRLAYALSALSAIAAFAAAWRFVEPPGGGDAQRPDRQLRAVARQLREPSLVWVFAFTLAMTVLNHVPYEFFQPYTALLLAPAAEALPGDYSLAPPVTGALMAAAMAIGAWASGRAVALGRRLGTARALIAMAVLQGAVIAAMAWAVHPLILVLVAARSLPGAVSGPLTSGVIQPRLPEGLRATYLSVQSLAGRLAFSGALAVTALRIGDDAPASAAVLSQAMWPFAVMAALVGGALWLTRDRLSGP